MGRRVSKDPIVIGFLGTRGSGKTSCANYLVGKYGAKKFSFATPIKALAQSLYGFTDEQIYGDWITKESVVEKTGASPREAFQRIGEAMRDVAGKNVWVDICFNLIAREYIMDSIHKDPPYIYVIDDVRRPNEAKRCRMPTATNPWNKRQARGMVVKLDPADVKFDDEFSKHVSEADVERVSPYDISHTISVRHCERNYEDIYRELDDIMDYFFDEMENDGMLL